jgi:long-chain acyl-CoA synthetase
MSSHRDAAVTAGAQPARQMVPAPSSPTLPLHRFQDRTVPALALRAASRHGTRTFLSFVDPSAPAAPPRTVTFAEFARAIARAAAFLRGSGVRAGDRVLLLAENAPEWQAWALGAQALRAEPAALFATLAAAPAAEIALRVRPRVAFVSGPEQWAKLAPVADALAAAGLAAVIAGEGDLGPLPPGVAAGRSGAALGEGAPEADLAALAAEVREEDPFLLLFTSGTTGRPKGVRLAQRAILHAVDGGAVATGRTERDLGLHFLPFGHVAGHDQFVLALAQGHALAMVVRREDIPRALALRPTYVFSVPLVYERIREAALAKVAALPAAPRRLVGAALAAAERVRVDGSRSRRDRALSRVADLAVGRAVRRRLGGRIEGLFSGGAAAAPALFRFFEGLGIPLVELYGMTETAGLISSNLFEGRRSPGVAGLLSPDHEVRVAPDGELSLRGPLLMTGYLDAEDDAAARDGDGFFLTGDLARIGEDGLLRIEGRKKHLLVLSTGKKLSPEPIEQAIAGAAPFQGALVVGEGKPFVAAVVFVAREELSRLAAAGVDAAEALLPRARAALAAFSEWEKPKRLLVLPGAPQDHPALVTPTLKLRREAVLSWLAPSLSDLYA